MAWSNTHSADFEASSSQYLSRSNDAYDLTTGTIEMWIKPESITSLDTLISTYANAGAQGFCVRLNASSQIDFFFGAGSNIATGSTALSAGTWYHVAVTWDTTEKIVYINGAQDGINTVDETLTAGAANLNVGRDVASANRYYDGLMDDVRIWNTKRTVTEIANNRRGELVGNESGLLSYWKLNNALTDTTSGARTLTNNNTVTFSSTDVGFPGTFTTTETAGVPTEVVSFTTTQPITVSETAGAPVESVKTRYGFSNDAKSSTTVVNQDKT